MLVNATMKLLGGRMYEGERAERNRGFWSATRLGRLWRKWAHVPTAGIRLRDWHPSSPACLGGDCKGCKNSI